jgi:hypothetical protein
MNEHLNLKVSGKSEHRTSDRSCGVPTGDKVGAPQAVQPLGGLMD